MTATQLLSVLIVDDHPLFREGLASIFDDAPDIRVVGEAASGREALAQCRRQAPDVVVMDIQMPDLDGIEATFLIKRECPRTKVVVLTTFDGDIHARRALEAGAAAYLLKSRVRKELVETIRGVHAGEYHVDPAVARAMTMQVRADGLTQREVQVLELASTGKTNKLIGSQLGISEATVAVHMKNVLAKLSANDRTHAVMLALERGILDFRRR